MKSGQFVRRLRPWCLVAPLLASSAVWAAAPESPRAGNEARGAVAPAHGEIFATVNGKAISLREYEAAFANLVRQKFYHGQVPEQQLQEAREETKNKLVQRVLLLEEAGRRGIVPDPKEIDEAIAGYDRQYAGSPVWKERREALLPDLRRQLGEQYQLSHLERAARQVPEPTAEEVRAFYDAQPELFTEPEKFRMSAILLAVDPSSGSAVWQATRAEAAAIYKRLQEGGNFEEAARLHSNGKFADDGGNMGYLHRGMLPEDVQKHMDSFEVGKINPPIDTLEGVVILRLDERLPPKKREFADVAQRARDLLVRERQDKAWKDLLDRLTASADVKIHFQLGTGSREGKGS